MEWHGLHGLASVRTSRSHLFAVARSVCVLYEIPLPQIRFEAAKQWDGMYTTMPACRVTLSTARAGGLSPLTMLHELAHYVINLNDPTSRLPDHGPEFVGVYGHMVESAWLIPRGSWEPLCRQFGVRGLRLARRTPASLQRLVKKRAAEAARR